MEDLSETARACFECPVCTLHIRPPVRQCTLGHIMCNNCFYRVPHCPTCRGPRSTEPAINFEPFFELISFPCKYMLLGCKVVRRGHEILRHEERCIFGQKICPLSLFIECDWTGAYCDIFEHCAREHPRYTDTLPRKHFDITGIENVTKTVDYFKLGNDEDRIMILACRVYANQVIHWRFIDVGPPGLPPRYRSLRNPRDQTMGIIKSNVLQPDEDIFSLFDPEKCRRNDVVTTLNFLDGRNLDENSVFFTDQLGDFWCS